MINRKGTYAQQNIGDWTWKNTIGHKYKDTCFQYDGKVNETLEKIIKLLYFFRFFQNNLVVKPCF